MEAERWLLVEEIFGQALDRPPEERAGFAERACGGDDDLLWQVRSLLRADQEAGGFLDRPVGPAGEEPGAAGEDPPWRGARIGPYRLIGKLGEGGMSTVYLAEREDEQYRRRVAIKVVRGALAGEDQLRRFRAERQILASLDHPGIARLYDGGATEEGLPCLVMEYVEGEPIDEYCDRHLLSVAERIELFRKVCAAVHYAHQNLVVHRDLKPGNILVTAAGEPKLLDFGIAKLLKPELLAAGSAPTARWLRLLTPDYASPEQVLGRPITTASDVYSLGVLLYKLLTGRLPRRLEGRSPEEVERVLSAEEAAKPSAGAADAEAAARSRRVPPGQLRRQLAGDLDNIVLMALRREPQRRYGSAEQLSEDLRRHLDGLPVAAHPDSFAYRAGKLLRRHRLGLAAAGAAGLVLAAAALALALQSRRLASERDRARSERDKARQVAAFLEDIFEASNPGEARGEAVTARELLDRGARKIEAIADQPRIQADLLTTVGRIYRELGVYDQSGPLLERALDLRREGAAGGGEEVAESLRELGHLRYRQGAYEEAQALLREGLRLLREAGGERGPAVASTLGDLAAVAHARGRYDEAEAQYRQALALLPDAAGAPPPELPELQNNFASLLIARGEYDEAERLQQRALAAWRRSLGQNHPTTVLAVNNLAALLHLKGDYAGAIARYQEALGHQRKLLGDAHPDVALSLSNLAVLLHNQGRLAEAEQRAREALALRRRLFGDSHPDVAQSLNNLGSMLREEGRLAEAEPLLREALRVWRESYDGEHPFVAKGLNNLALLEAARGRVEAAEEGFRRALAMRRRLLGDDHPETAVSLLGLGQLLSSGGRLAEAEPLLRQALDIRRRRLPAAHPQLAEAERALGDLFIRSQRFAEAEPLLLDSHRILGGERARQRRQGSYGMTWLRSAANPAAGTVQVGCGWPCNPYGGDTPCSASLPLLCVRDEGLPNPGFALDRYHGWIGGRVSATQPVRGTELTGLAAADGICAARLGAGWRMAEFHHSAGGWSWNALGDLPAGQRFWVRIDDQPGNCWDS